MDCCSDRNISEFESPLYRIESDRTLLIKKERLQRESREQCGFCCMFTGAAIGTSVSIASTHGSTLPVDVPGLVVSGSSAAMCAERKDFISSKLFDGVSKCDQEYKIYIPPKDTQFTAI